MHDVHHLHHASKPAPVDSLLRAKCGEKINSTVRWRHHEIVNGFSFPSWQDNPKPEPIGVPSYRILFCTGTRKRRDRSDFGATGLCVSNYCGPFPGMWTGCMSRRVFGVL